MSTAGGYGDDSTSGAFGSTAAPGFARPAGGGGRTDGSLARGGASPHAARPANTTRPAAKRDGREAIRGMVHRRPRKTEISCRAAIPGHREPATLARMIAAIAGDIVGSVHERAHI